LAAIAVALTTARFVGGDLATLHRRAASLGARHSVVVATHDLELGEIVGTRDVRTESRYASQIPHDAITDVRTVRGKVVVVPVLRDSIVFTRHLTAANRSGLDGVVPVGDRAVHVSPKDGFRPAPGAVVDVLAAFDPTAVTVVGGGDAAVVVASGARVLGLDSTTSSSDSADTPASAGVTVLVTDTEARAIAFAAANADLTLAIAPPESARGLQAAP
jgi:Flp pilus assembly protein CpaB